MGKLVRSVSVGAVATAGDLLALVVLVDVCDLTPSTANVPALVLGLGVQFFGNKLFAFRDRSRALVRQGALFVAVEVGALVLNAVAFQALVGLGVPFLVSRLVASALVYLTYSYPLWGRIFRHAAASAASHANHASSASSASGASSKGAATP